MRKVSLEPQHLKIIVEILKAFSCKAMVYGSRAKGMHHKLSDLDLLIETSIPKSDLAKLREEFDESNLPFKVDITLRADMSDDFYAQIRQDLIPVY